MDYSELTHLDLKKELVFLLLKAMVAYDELGSLVPIKRTLQVIDYQNQANKESEVRRCSSTCPIGPFVRPLPIVELSVMDPFLTSCHIMSESKTETSYLRFISNTHTLLQLDFAPGHQTK